MKKIILFLLIVTFIAEAQRPRRADEQRSARSPYAQSILWRDLHKSTQDSIRQAVADSLAALSTDGVTITQSGSTFQQKVFANATAAAAVSGTSDGMTIFVDSLGLFMWADSLLKEDNVEAIASPTQGKQWRAVNRFKYLYIAGDTSEVAGIRFKTQGTHRNPDWRIFVQNGGLKNHDHPLIFGYNVRHDDYAGSWKADVDREHSVRVGYESGWVDAPIDPDTMITGFEFNIDIATDTSKLAGQTITFDRRPWFFTYQPDGLNNVFGGVRRPYATFTVGDSRDNWSPYFSMGVSGSYHMVFAGGRNRKGFVFTADSAKTVETQGYPKKFVINPAQSNWDSAERGAGILFLGGDGEDISLEPGKDSSNVSGHLYLGIRRKNKIGIGAMTSEPSYPIHVMSVDTTKSTLYFGNDNSAAHKIEFALGTTSTNLEKRRGIKYTFTGGGVGSGAILLNVLGTQALAYKNNASASEQLNVLGTASSGLDTTVFTVQTKGTNLGRATVSGQLNVKKKTVLFDSATVGTSTAGDSTLWVAGSGHFATNVNIGGKLNVGGVVDPPAVSFTAETRTSIRKLAKTVQEKEKVLIYWNVDTHKMEVYHVEENKFYDMMGNLLQ